MNLRTRSSEFLFYQSKDGRTRLQVRMEGETVWLSQRDMAELFQTTKQNVSLHIRNLFAEGELRPEATVKEYLTVQTEGSRQVERPVDHYNLDVIISVDYATSIDYDPSVDASKRFFQTIQSKMHWAIVRQTAAEIVHDRASAAKPQMGLTSWSGDQPRKGDVGVAKNYLNEDEIKALNLIVSAYLDFAELQAVARRPMHMADWIRKLDDFIRMSDRAILTHAGTISHETARLKAEAEYDAFRVAQAALPSRWTGTSPSRSTSWRRSRDQPRRKGKPGRKKGERE